MKDWIGVGAVFSALAIVCGAFGAHALRARLDPEQLEIWRTAVLYHLIGALALVLYGLLVRGRPGRGIAGWCFLLGILIFSGSLYSLALGAPRILGAVTPVGGVLLIAGWLFFAWEARRHAS